MVSQKNKYVQGYICADDERICQIIGRADEEGSLLEHGAMFKVRFGDGSIETVAGHELHPWFPTD